MRRVMILVCVSAAVVGSVAEVRGAEFSAKAVDQAIERAIKALWSAQQPNGSWGGHGGKYPLGPTALVAYALLESGVDVNEPRMLKALQFLAYTATEKTYSLGLRASVYLAASEKDPQYRKALIADVVQIIKSTRDGSYNYDCRGDGKSSGDNSNSQYGLLGVWAGARARPHLEIPRQYWLLVWKHWVKSQNDDGGWGYRKDKTRATMTAAGVASLFVCYDNLLLLDSGVRRCRTSQELANAQKPIQRGLDWFDKNFARSLGGGGHLYYYLYGVERVGLASGYKYFGKLDWYKMGASKLLGGRRGGGWGSPANTAFGLLFLIRGRNAVAFNKLQFSGDWNNRPRDLANMTRWLSRKIEKTVNWQIINLSVPVGEWHDSPILYISGAKSPKFTDKDIKALRTFVYQGGTIFSVTECHGSGFTEGMYNAYGKMFPNYKVADCPAKHPLYNVYFKLRSKPRFKIVSNGVRPLAIHVRDDLSLEWQQGNIATKKHTFEAAANVYMYVTDKLSSVRRRGTTPWPAKASGRGQTVTLARLKYTGNYDPEPLAYERFTRLMAREHNMNVKVVGPIAISELARAGVKLAALTGTDSLTLSAEEIEALKSFVGGGGTLLIDAAGGDDRAKGGFISGALAAVGQICPGVRVRTLSASSPLYNLPNMKIDTVRWRRGTKVRMVGTKRPMIKGAIVDGRPAVLLSEHDITAGLVGFPSASVYGYHQGDEKGPSTAFKLMRNIVLYANR